MKLIPSCVFLLLTAGATSAADPVIEFRGVMTGEGPTKLSLVDKASDTAVWVQLGQVFVGYTVKSYDSAKETATLTKEGKEYRIRLNTSKIEEATPVPVLSGGAVRAIRNNLRQIGAAADQYFLETGKKSVTVAELVGPDKYIKELKPVEGENYNSLRLSPDDGSTDKLAVITASGAFVELKVGEVTPPSQELLRAFVSPAPSTHAVGPGDTAKSIAARYQLKESELQALNPDVNWKQLKVGQSVKVK